MKRVFMIVIDGFGIGEMPDAKDFGDEGSNTIASCAKAKNFSLPVLKKLGLFNIDGVNSGSAETAPIASFGRMKELSMGKDTTVGHWELMGNVRKNPFPVYPNGFPKNVIAEFEKITKRGTLCNLPYSGTKVLEDFGKEHLKTGKLIVYTSADSVFQVAAHTDIVSVETLYSYCQKARELLQGENAVARVIARPFEGVAGSFVRTNKRHDYSIEPGRTALDILTEKGFDTIGVGKIYDIFAGKGIGKSYPTSSNKEGLEKTLELMSDSFSGLCFVNLVDTDMLYGHRNDAQGFANALMEIDAAIPAMLNKLTWEDTLIITADHGCDPGTASTDHSREYVPILVYKKEAKPVNLGTMIGFCNASKIIFENLDLERELI